MAYVCYQGLSTTDTVSNVGIFNPALWTVALLTFSLVQPYPFPCVNKYIVLYESIQCVRGGMYGFLGLRQINTSHKVPLQVNFFNDDILLCLLWVLSFDDLYEYCTIWRNISTVYIFVVFVPPLLVQRCNGTTAGLGYLEVNVICPRKSPHWTVD